ncbi:MAG: PQQ-dependent sugar dehydrogenase [Weeksellaceae bacterium]|nr:PQQ-dependent sugar dehydrogenase [Weeksellaceae bacterium]
MNLTTKSLLLAAGCMAFVACSNQSQQTTTTVSTTNDTVAQTGTGTAGQSQMGLEPVESKNRITDFQPAFEGQTRAPGMKSSFDVQVNKLAGNLNKPWAIIELPDGNFLITQKGGDMVIFGKDGSKMSDIAGFPKVDDAGQGGMLDVVLDPSFAQNNTIYWSFSEPYQNGNLTAVAKGVLNRENNRIDNPTVIYRAIPAYDGDKHYGSRLVFDKDGLLYVGTGERSDKVTRPQAQQLNSANGKVLRITKDGKPANGNPQFSDANALPEIYSYGHRNIQGMAFHPTTGELWVGEFGPKGGDEINLVKAGKDYGWPTITYGIEYSGDKVGAGITQQEGMEQPVYYWDPAISFSGMDFYTHDAIPEWKNDLFLACLATNHIARVKIENNRVIAEERLATDQRERFRDVLAASDGSLYAVTDGGSLYRIGR